MSEENASIINDSQDHDWKFGIALIIFLLLININQIIAIAGSLAWFLYLYSKKELL